MPFSKLVKDAAKWRSTFRCCVCHEVFVEVHHILPEADGGPSVIENAAPLCARHHDLFGGNPEKRAAIRMMRDAWWEEVESIRSSRTNFHNRDETYAILVDGNVDNGLLDKRTSIYHMVREEDTYEQTAQTIWSLLKHAQQSEPNVQRYLYVDIIGHEGPFHPDAGRWLRWNGEIMDFQACFSRTFLLQYFREIHLPLWTLENNRAQNNDLPIDCDLHISLYAGNDSNIDAEIARCAANKSELYIGHLGVVIKPEDVVSSLAVTVKKRARQPRPKKGS